MRISFKLRLAVVVMVGLGTGVGLSIYQSSQKQIAFAVASPSVTIGAGRSTSQSGGQSSPPAVGRSTMAVVERVGDREFSVKANSSPTPVTIRLSDQTTIRKQIPGTLSEIKPGQRVSVRGEPDTDGNIVAASIQLVALGADGVVAPGGAEAQSHGQRARSGGGDSTPGRTGDWMQGGMGESMQGATSDSAHGGMSGPAPGGAGGVIGTVEKVDKGLISITGTGGAPDQSPPVRVTVSDKTRVTKTIAGESKDITEGAYVLVNGPRGADGVVVATSVEILPAEAVQMMRRQ